MGMLLQLPAPPWTAAVLCHLAACRRGFEPRRRYQNRMKLLKLC